MNIKDSDLLKQVKGGLDTYLMIGLSDVGDSYTATFGLYDKDGNEIDGDVLDLLTYVRMTYQYVADGMNLPVEKIHDMMGKAMGMVDK